MSLREFSSDFTEPDIKMESDQAESKEIKTEEVEPDSMDSNQVRNKFCKIKRHSI